MGNITELNLTQIEWMLFGSFLTVIVILFLGEIRAITDNRNEEDEANKLNERMLKIQYDLELLQHSVTSIKRLLDPNIQAEGFEIERRGMHVVVKETDE